MKTVWIFLENPDFFCRSGRIIVIREKALAIPRILRYNKRQKNDRLLFRFGLEQRLVVIFEPKSLFHIFGDRF